METFRWHLYELGPYFLNQPYASLHGLPIGAQPNLCFEKGWQSPLAHGPFLISFENAEVPPGSSALAPILQGWKCMRETVILPVTGTLLPEAG